jgi:hypothetical protein
MRLPLLLRPSTRTFTREARHTPGYSLFAWLHGYVYARWPYLYIGSGECTDACRFGAQSARTASYA